jgi:hypothetical protein
MTIADVKIQYNILLDGTISSFIILRTSHMIDTKSNPSPFLLLDPAMQQVMNKYQLVIHSETIERRTPCLLISMNGINA